MTDLTCDELDELSCLLACTTEGEWSYEAGSLAAWHADHEGGRLVMEWIPNGRVKPAHDGRPRGLNDRRLADGAFAAAAHNLMGRLLAELIRRRDAAVEL